MRLWGRFTSINVRKIAWVLSETEAVHENPTNKRRRRKTGIWSYGTHPTLHAI